MRQQIRPVRRHAHPIRRPHRRRRIALTATGGALVLLVAAAMVLRLPATSAPGAAAAGLSAAAVLQPTPSRSIPPTAAVPDPTRTSPSASPSPQPTPPATSGADPAAASARLAHLAIDLRQSPRSLALLTGYVWPIAHPRLTLPFGPTLWGTRVVGGKLFHDGVDLATFCGDRIMAAHSGVVLAAGRHFDDDIGWVGDLTAYYKLLDVHHLWNDLPNVVIIDDGNTYRSVYAHFGRVVVHVGQHVRAGQLIGYEGMTGHATGCHLHYGVFSPLETATFGIQPKVVKDLRVPKLEIARVDPLLVLPYRRGISGPVKNLGSG
jgi:murein DD-endopeptidase MepM/ murein hydrolase activator NlpD